MTQKCKMDLMALMNSRIDQIIETVGSGMKSLISDEDTMKSVSLSCPQSRIMKKEVFLFEVLHSRCVDCKKNVSTSRVKNLSLIFICFYIFIEYPQNPTWVIWNVWFWLDQRRRTFDCYQRKLPPLDMVPTIFSSPIKSKEQTLKPLRKTTVAKLSRTFGRSLPIFWSLNLTFTRSRCQSPLKT